VSYAHHNHQSLFQYDRRSSTSRAYMQVVAALMRCIASVRKWIEKTV
jgi:hypothetical protein